MKTHRSPWTIVITSSSEVSIIFFWNFWDRLMHFPKPVAAGDGDVEGVRSFHVTAPVGCFRMEPRFSRSGLIVARGAPCIQTCTFRSPKLFMQLINCFNIESCERGTVTDMALSQDSFASWIWTSKSSLVPRKVESLLFSWQDGQDFFFHHTLWDQVTRAIGP